MTTACLTWLGREFLTRRVEPGSVWESPTVLVKPSGRRLVLPLPCPHPAADCPPLPPAQRTEAAA